MKFRTSAWLLLILLAMIAVTMYLINNSQDKTSLILADRDFAVKDINSITKIYLATRQKDPILLEKVNGVWILNKKYKVSENPLKNLLHTLRDIRMQSIPAKGHVKSIMEGLAVFGIKVEIYGEDDEKLKTFYIGGTTQHEYGTYFFMEHGTQPYIMEIPHFAGNLRERFDLDETDWRDKSVFTFTGSGIESIQLDYPFQPEQSFLIKKEENDYGLFAPENKSGKLKSITAAELKKYVENFESIGAEAIQNDHPARKEIQNIQAYCHIRIQEVNESNHISYNVYPIAVDTSGKVNYQFDHKLVSQGVYFRMHVDRSDGDFLLVQYPNVQGIFRKRQDFIQ